ncbi:hypothetical protein EYC80_010193 [Monilinia laxa]|uniref:2EXR domain-containing protein n=1 Tax=Monilinia laxa TaxID=61186 RepID=A0A5N6JNB6_MONLA|nr:hypothetical protein EYC80_010193 [Monilinia laxa]
MKLRSRTKIGQAMPSPVTRVSPIPKNATTTALTSPNPGAASFGPGTLSKFSTITVNAICPAPIYSFDGILKSFPVFDYLTKEVRCMIWRAAGDLNPRNNPIQTVPHIGPGGFQFQSKIPIPPEFFACKDYFGEVRKRYVILYNRLQANDMSLAQYIPPKLWFNPAIDRFCLVSHWTPQEFNVGIRLLFEFLQASKIAVSVDCAEKPEYNLNTWQTIFHHKNIPK